MGFHGILWDSMGFLADFHLDNIQMNSMHFDPCRVPISVWPKRRKDLMVFLSVLSVFRVFLGVFKVFLGVFKCV